ncbi:cell division protein PerM [Microbacterium gorillae]|uniref:cell division protein PerM n=1 Tax=Microbacterium gorillae TaxID=1231063 RepID=UPI003D99C4AC
MHRLTVALLAAFDALVAAAVGLAVIGAPLALFWATAADASWAGLWPLIAKIWQLGGLAPVTLTLPESLLTALGVAPDAGGFIFSLAPLALTAFVAIFAARSGVRAMRAGAGTAGVLSGAVVYTAIAVIVQLTSAAPLAHTITWQAILHPALVYAVPAVVGALVVAWRDGDRGLVDWVHDRVDETSVQWSELPALAARGIAITCVSLVGAGALAVLVAVVLRGGEVISLFQSARVDVWGAVLISLASFAYLPTLVVWALAWISGAGITVGVGSTLTPAAVHLGVVPALPPLGLLPSGGTPLMLAVVIVPVAIGALAGWVLRSEFVAVLGEDEPLLPRIVLSLSVAAGAAGFVAILGALARGGIGPGRLVELGPHPGFVALAVGVEVLVGVAILLLSPRRHRDEF